MSSVGQMGAAFGLALAAGVSFSLIGIAYRLGQGRGVMPPQILLVTAVVGAFFYGARCRGMDWAGVPMAVVGLGVAAGLTQYLAVKLVAMGLKAGPLSPVWCAVSLTFVPVTLYATAVFSEPLGAMRGLGVVAAMGCVVMASMGQDEAAGRAGLSSWRGRALYGALLVTILLANSVSDVAMKEMGTRTVSGVAGAASYVKQYGDLFVTLLYAFLAAGVVGDMVVRRKGREPGMATGRLKVALGLGVVAAVGSIGGIWLTQQFAGSHAAMAFTVRGAASILAASVVSVIAFRERFSRRWVGTVGLGVLAVVMAAPWGQSQSTRPERPADVQNQAMSSNVNKATVSAGQ